MTGHSTQPAIDPVGIVELNHRARELESHAISLYLADPASMTVLRDVFARAEAAVAREVGQLSATRSCPAGTVKCPRGCCYVGAMPTRE